MPDTSQTTAVKSCLVPDTKLQQSCLTQTKVCCLLLSIAVLLKLSELVLVVRLKFPDKMQAHRQMGTYRRHVHSQQCAPLGEILNFL